MEATIETKIQTKIETKVVSKAKTFKYLDLKPALVGVVILSVVATFWRVYQQMFA